LSNEKSYILKLNEDLGWILTCTAGTRAWLGRLADIMELGPPNGTERPLSRVTFIRGTAGSKSLGEAAGTADVDLINQLRSEQWSASELTFVVIWYHHSTSDIYCELLNAQSHYLEVMMMAQSLFPFYRAATEQGGIPLHSALAEQDGAGILLVGRGGMGKSTCCNRLPPEWNVMCDDETLIVRENTNFYVAHPFPTWGDYLLRRSQGTWDVCRRVPLAAVFFLARAGVDSAIPVGRGEASVLINQSATQVCVRQMDSLKEEERRVWRKALFANACDLARELPAFRLEVSPAGDFRRAIEEVLSGLR
jgi:SynChlorMet cassette protein ScmC